MVYHFYAQNLSGFYQSPVNLQIIPGRLRISGRMVVRQDNLSGMNPHRRLKNLPRVNQTGIKRTYGNNLPFYLLVAAIQIKDDKMLLF